jgi:hypothetical protein
MANRETFRAAFRKKDKKKSVIVKCLVEVDFVKIFKERGTLIIDLKKQLATAEATIYFLTKGEGRKEESKDSETKGPQE